MFSSRRGFLLGAAGLITSSFLRDARNHIEKRSTPLLLEPKEIEQTLYVINDGDHYSAALGSVDVHAPDTWSWLEYIEALKSEAGGQFHLKRFLAEGGLKRSDLDEPMDRRAFESYWYREHNPVARAYHLLEPLDLGPEFSGRGRHAGEIRLVDDAFGDCGVWTEIEDDLSVTLLQARLIELEMPIKVELTTWR